MIRYSSIVDGDTSKYTIRLLDVNKEFLYLKTKLQEEVEDRVNQQTREKEFNSIKRVINKVNNEEQWKALRIFDKSGWISQNPSVEIYKKFPLEDNSEKYYQGYLFI